VSSVIFAAALMVSKVPFYSFKNTQSMNRMPFTNAIMIPLIFILILLDPPLVLTVMASTYVASGPINSLIIFVKKLHIRSQNSSHSK
jgi:CDP-diacylglycerol--serine O-phosphatidyltransferase